LNAQQTDEITKLVYDFAKSYSEIDTVRDTEHVLRYVDKELKSSLTDFDPVKGAKTFHSDFFGLNEHLSSLIRNNIKIKYSVDKILKVDLSGHFAYTLFEASYKATLGGKPFDNGTETVMMTFIKRDNNWKISNYYVVDVKKENPKTVCYATVFKSTQHDNQQLIVKLDTPDGRSLLSDFLSFAFEKNKEGGWYIKHKDTTFETDKNGNIKVLSTSSDVKGTGKVKDATNVNELAFVIIKHFLFSNLCEDILIR
jgi:ketosteroid isomerase-like protein